MNKDKTIEKRAGFTPGPYRLSSSIHVEEHGEQEYMHLTAREKHSDIGMVQIARFDPIRSIDLANARLIASAPELHAQAKLFERALVELQMQGETGVDEQLTQLREILAKVDGRAEG